MTLSADLVLKCVFAIVYAALGALIGGAFVFVSLKMLMLFMGTDMISVKTLQALVIGTAAVAALLSAIGYLRQKQ